MEKFNLDDENVKKQIVDMVLRQTDYTYEEALLKLESNSFNFQKVIKNYIKDEKIGETKIDNLEKLTINQQIFKEIRTLMDGAERNKRFLDELNNRVNSK